jgi:hypothetical protein
VEINVEIPTGLNDRDTKALAADPLARALKLRFDISARKAKPGESRLVVAVRNDAGQDNTLVRLALEVDRRPLVAKAADGGVLPAGGRESLIDRPVAPGAHSVGARLVFEGQTGKRRGLQVDAAGGIDVTIEEDKVVEVTVVGALGEHP